MKTKLTLLAPVPQLGGLTDVNDADYRPPLVEAAVLVKVIMIGDALRFGQAFRNRPLIVPAVFTNYWLGMS